MCGARDVVPWKRATSYAAFRRPMRAPSVMPRSLRRASPAVLGLGRFRDRFEPRRPAHHWIMRTLPLLPFLVLAIPTTAAAAELHYEAPDGCPSQSDVKKRVDERAPNSGPVGVIVRSDELEGGFLANVVVGAGADAVRRELHGRTCESVVDAAVLVAALAPEVRRAATQPLPPEGRAETNTDAKATAAPEIARSSFELGVGVTATVRQFSKALDTPTGAGGGLFVEASAPALWASWFRPSARLGSSISPTERAARRWRRSRVRRARS